MTIKLALSRAGWLQFLSILFGIASLVGYAVSKLASGWGVIAVTISGFIGYLAVLVLLAFQKRGFYQWLKSAGLSLVMVILGGYLILFGMVYFYQGAIANGTSTFFQPRPLTAGERLGQAAGSNVSSISLTTPDGVTLRGWSVRNTAEPRSPLVIFFGGSGSEMSEFIPRAKGINGWTVVLMNYRGFGESDGVPTHDNSLADSLFIYDSLVKGADVDPDRVVAMGYSLGTGVAVHLSEQRPVTATILAAPFDYWTLDGVKHSPVYAPVRGIMKRFYDSLSRASRITSPLLVLAGTNDTVVPPVLSRNLADQWGGQVTFIEYEGEDHGFLFHENSSWKDIQTFLAKAVKE